ncbi:hypothetical protein [Streptomyces sp. NBC_01361]|uniref:hypothetical protein n=1 Tax=Streptomyces sp. NBC_01361 TaxID=2903838 RepID=UPI002E3584C2|nr:hypothetical protein [Streptomyces sp. NBC_01361]
MHFDSSVENRASGRGSHRKRGKGADEGPVFVDSSGRRAKLLRRFGLAVVVACLGYAVVLGLSFMGWGVSVSTTDLLPFGGAGGGGGGGGTGTGRGPAAGYGAPGVAGQQQGTPPTTRPSLSPSPSLPAPSASAAADAH